MLDSYSLFDIKRVGEWRIIGREVDYEPTNVENVYFTYGEGLTCKKVDVFGNEISISENESKEIQEN